MTDSEVVLPEGVTITRGKRGWRVNSWYHTKGQWARREAAEAVAQMEPPSVELLMREVEYWRNSHKSLVKRLRKFAYKTKQNDEALLGMVYAETGGKIPSPLSIREAHVAMSTLHKRVGTVAPETDSV